MALSCAMRAGTAMTTTSATIRDTAMRASALIIVADHRSTQPFYESRKPVVEVTSLDLGSVSVRIALAGRQVQRCHNYSFYATVRELSEDLVVTRVGSGARPANPSRFEIVTNRGSLQ